MADVEMVEGSDLPELPIAWLDRDGAVIDFSTGWTFELAVKKGSTEVLTKTTAIGGFDESPNIVIAWDLEELDVLSVGSTYVCTLLAERDSDSLRRRKKFTFALT